MSGIFFRYFWVLAIVGICVQVYVIKLRVRKYIQAVPERKAGYDVLLRGMLFWFNIPWIVMGIGMVTGKAPTVFHFFRPREGNPFVLAWFGIVFALWFLGTFWLLFKKGAEKLVEYPGFFNPEIKNPMMIKVIWFISLLGGIIAVVMMWISDFPIPTFL